MSASQIVFTYLSLSRAHTSNRNFTVSAAPTEQNIYGNRNVESREKTNRSEEDAKKIAHVSHTGMVWALELTIGMR